MPEAGNTAWKTICPPVLLVTKVIVLGEEPMPLAVTVPLTSRLDWSHDSTVTAPFTFVTSNELGLELLSDTEVENGANSLVETESVEKATKATTEPTTTATTTTGTTRRRGHFLRLTSAGAEGAVLVDAIAVTFVRPTINFPAPNLS
jgi:hypothetical protein